MQETTDKQEYEYEDLLKKVKIDIAEKYGSIGAYTNHPDFKEHGFTGASDYTNFPTYMSAKGKNGKAIRSFPTLQKLYMALYNETLDSKIRVTRTQTIIGNKSLGDMCSI